MDNFAEVILPLPLNATFTYRIPAELCSKVKPGYRVIIQFGAKKIYTGIVESINVLQPKDYDVKDILMVLDKQPIIRYPQLKFWKWISEYYLCALGDVYKAALPAGLKVESETMVELNPDVDFADYSTLTERESIVCALLRQNGRLSSDEISKKLGFKNVEGLLSSLLEKDVVVISEKLVERYRVKKETYVRINANRQNNEFIRDAFAAVKGAKKQEIALLALLELSNYNHKDKPLAEVSKAALMERSGVTANIVKALESKGIIEQYIKEISRFKFSGNVAYELPKLSEAQTKALRQIHDSFLDNNITLLHGVTASGKTEVYIHLIDYALKQKNQALFLVPEIALTTQLTRRLQRVFGDKVIIYHSKFSDNERVEIWNKLLNARDPYVVIGARSSIFLPFSNLGLIIVDEEHESSYKQYEPSPRYNARDAAMVLAMMHGAKTLLGSATPSVETYYKASNGKYGLVSLLERYDGAKLPLIEVVDMTKARKRMQVRGSFASETVQYAREAIDNQQQVIFFHNRRGFAPLAQCKQCAYIPKCENCSVSLTYHRRQNQLVCHYCGATYPMPSICPSCHEPEIEVVGYGTERIEEDVQNLFPNSKILRMDLDTTRNKDSYENIIDDFSAHKADILVGTQMVTKGLDFGGVSVVGVINADTIINFPDFRSSERAFNMLEQVSGRAGRRATDGKVLLQTYQPNHPIISFISNHDYQGFYQSEIEERKLYNYPPFTRVIYIYIKHRDCDSLVEIAAIYANKLRQLFGTRVSGPEEPFINRIQSLYIRKIMLKVEVNASMKKVKDILRTVYEDMHKSSRMKGMIVYYDVDPM